MLVSARIACARFRMGDAPSAKLVVADPKKITADLGAWWAIRAEILQALGEHIYERFVEAKREEWDEYRMQVTRWELERYLPIV